MRPGGRTEESLSQIIREELSVGRERAVLVAVLLDNRPLSGEPLTELADLVRSAGAVIADRVVQRRKKLDPTTCVGKGKLEEIRQRADASDAGVVIFDNDLTPSQISR